jgi:hypothetical protein
MQPAHPGGPFHLPPALEQPMAQQQNAITDADVLNVMERYGGSFVKALAVAWRRADAENRDKLMRAFWQYWDQYAAMAAAIQRSEHA